MAPSLLIPLLLLLLLLLGSPSTTHAVTQQQFDCPARRLTLRHAISNLQSGAVHASAAASVYDALRLHECGDSPPPSLPRTLPPSAPASSATGSASSASSASPSLYVSTTGSDATGTGTLAAPFRSLHRARDAARTPGAPRVIQVLGGRYELDAELTLGPEDSDLTITAYEGADVVLCGGKAMTLALSPVADTARKAMNLPPGCMQASVPLDGDTAVRAMYEDADVDVDVGGGGTAGRAHAASVDPTLGGRMPWAREPNGMIETDLQPDGCVA